MDTASDLTHEINGALKGQVVELFDRAGLEWLMNWLSEGSKPKSYWIERPSTVSLDDMLDAGMDLTRTSFIHSRNPALHLRLMMLNEHRKIMVAPSDSISERELSSLAELARSTESTIFLLSDSKRGTVLIPFAQ